jgi:hypothetical protein
VRRTKFGIIYFRDEAVGRFGMLRVDPQIAQKIIKLIKYTLDNASEFRDPFDAYKKVNRTDLK